jgi:hypothetical protein
MAPSDHGLIVKIRNGEGAAFEKLMRRYNQRIFRAARQELRRAVEKQLGNEVRRLCIFAGARCDRTVAHVFVKLGLLAQTGGDLHLLKDGSPHIHVLASHQFWSDRRIERRT